MPRCLDGSACAFRMRDGCGPAALLLILLETSSSTSATGQPLHSPITPRMQAASVKSCADRGRDLWLWTGASCKFSFPSGSQALYCIEASELQIRYANGVED